MTDFEQPLYGEDASPEVVTIDAKIYTLNQIRVCTFLGGPLAAGYLIAENFRAFNDYGKAKTAILIGVGATILLFVLLFLIPESVHIPNFILPLVYAWGAFILANSYQGKQIMKHFTTGGRGFNWGRAVVIALICAVVTVVFLLIGAFAIDAVTYSKQA